MFDIDILFILNTGENKMIYKLITTIEIDERSGSVNIIKSEKIRINVKSSDINDRGQIINGSHILRRSEPQYGIFIFSMQETPELHKALPLDSDITVIFENETYDAHTHSSKSGRINRLSNFYRNREKILKEDDTIQFAYNTDTKILEITDIIYK